MRVGARRERTRAAASRSADHTDTFNAETDGDPDSCSDAGSLTDTIDRHPSCAFTASFAADASYAISCDAAAIAITFACSFSDATRDPVCAARAVNIHRHAFGIDPSVCEHTLAR